MDIEEETVFVAAASSMVNILGGLAIILNEEERVSKKPRTCWVKPWRESRDPSGNIQSLLKEYKLYSDLKAYKCYLTMNETCFMDILSYVRNDIERFDTKLRKCIPVDEKLAVTLRFLATGESFKALAENTKLSLAYVSTTIIEVCAAIYKNMQPTFLKFPDNPAAWKKIAKEFDGKWQFPLCLGALDGKHVAMTPRKDRANLFYNYKGFHSIVLLALADAHAKFLFIDVGRNGRISDGGVFLRSLLSKVLDCDEYFPPESVVGNNRKLPYVVVADNAFPLGKHMLTPYSRSNLSMDKVVFNKRLSRARQNIERAFGILAKRFQIFQKQIALQEDKTKIIVKACCVLHNFLIDNSEWYRRDIEEMNEAIEENLTRKEPENTVEFKEPETIRKQFKEYFCFEGKL